MEKLLITCPTDGYIRKYISKHSNFQQTFPGEFESIADVDSFEVIASLISEFCPTYARIMRHDLNLVEFYVKEEN